jgi:hypothetical protein
LKGVSPQNIVFFIDTTVRTSNLTKSRIFNDAMKHAQENVKYMQSFGSDAVKEWPSVAYQWIVLKLCILKLSGSIVDPETRYSEFFRGVSLSL